MSVTSTAVLFDIIGRDRTGAGVKSAGSAFNKLAIGLAASAAFIGVKMVDAAGQFQAGIVRLQTGAGELHSNLGMVSEGVLKLMGDLGVSSEVANRALYMIESGGQHGADALRVLQAAGEGAKAEMADTAEVADALTSVLVDYHLKSTDAARVTSQMVTAVGMGKTTFQLFAESLHSVLPLASAAHISFADISGALASMTVHGMSADQATQDLADTIKHMAAPTGVQVRELGQLGLSASDLSGMLSTKGLTGTLQFLESVILKHMGPSGKILLDTFNKSRDAAADVNIMISRMPPNLAALAKKFQAGSINLAEWRTALKALPVPQAQLMSQFAALSGSATGFSSIIKAGGPAAQSYVDALRRVTGDATGLNTALMLTGENAAYTNLAVKTVGEATTEAGGHVKGWAEVQATFNQRMAEAKGTVSALGIRIGTALLPPVQDALVAVKSSVDWLSKHKGVAHALAITMGVLGAGFIAFRLYVVAASVATKAWMVVTKVAAGVMWLLDAAMDANPVGLIIIGIGLLVGAFIYLWKHCAWFRDFWIGAWHIIKGVGLAVGHWFAGPFAHFFVAGYHIVQHALGVAVAWIHARWSGVINFFSDMPNKISRIASGMWNGIKEAFRDVLNWIFSKWNSIHLTLPKINLGPLGSVGGFTLAVPQIPLLAQGGIVPATPGGRLVRVGEGGRDEAIIPLGRGGGSITLRAGDAMMREFLRCLAEEIRRLGGDPKLLNLKIEV